jgi:hypothetical protein
LLARFIAFYLRLDMPYWSGTAAAIVCQTVSEYLAAQLRPGAAGHRGFQRDAGQEQARPANHLFTSVRLARRIPVGIQIDQLPPDVRLVVG